MGHKLRKGFSSLWSPNLPSSVLHAARVSRDYNPSVKLYALAVTFLPLLGTLAFSQSARPLSQSRTFLSISGKYQPIFALCDALESPNIVAVTLPDAARKAQVFTFPKNGTGSYTFQTYGLGNADPGAGNVYFALNPQGGKPMAKDAAYALRQVNPAALEDPSQALTPTWTSLKTRDLTSSCRYQTNTRLLGFSSKRTYLVTETPQGELRYQTFDFINATHALKVETGGINRSSPPSLTLEGGSKQVTGKEQIFRFQNQGYTYTVSVARLGQNAGARVTVTKGDKTVVNEVLTGYVYSERR